MKEKQLDDLYWLFSFFTIMVTKIYIENMRLVATFRFFFLSFFSAVAQPNFLNRYSFYLPRWFNVSCFCLIFSLGGIIILSAHGLFKPLPVFDSFAMMNILCEWCWFDAYWFFPSFCLFFSPVLWGRIVRSRRVWTLEPSSLCDWKTFGLLSISEISLYYRNVDTIAYSRAVWNVWNIYFFSCTFHITLPSLS